MSAADVDSILRIISATGVTILTVWRGYEGIKRGELVSHRSTDATDQSKPEETPPTSPGASSSPPTASRRLLVEHHGMPSHAQKIVRSVVRQPGCLRQVGSHE